MIRTADRALHAQWSAYAARLGAHQRGLLRATLTMIRNCARTNATTRWNERKFEEACTDRIIAIYAGHLARAIASTTPPQNSRGEPALDQPPTRTAIAAATTVLPAPELLTLTVCLESLAAEAERRRDADWKRTKPGTARYWQCVSEYARALAAETRTRTRPHELPSRQTNDTETDRPARAQRATQHRRAPQ